MTRHRHFWLDAAFKEKVVAIFATTTFLFATTTIATTMNRAIREASGGVEADV